MPKYCVSLHCILLFFLVCVCVCVEIIILYFRWLLFSFLSSLGVDFHWYRLDQGGLWSHKPGQTRVTQGDKVGNDIVDPRTAANGNYLFVAFMTSDISAVTIN